MLQHLLQVGRDRLGDGADLGETVGDDLQPFYVLVHLRQQFVVGIVFPQDCCPCHQRGNGRTQLMGRLFAQAHPHLVLLRPLRGEQGHDRHDHEKHHHAQLDVRIDSYALQHQRFIIAHVYVISAAAA